MHRPRNVCIAHRGCSSGPGCSFAGKCQRIQHIGVQSDRRLRMLHQAAVHVLQETDIKVRVVDDQLGIMRINPSSSSAISAKRGCPSRSAQADTVDTLGPLINFPFRIDEAVIILGRSGGGRSVRYAAYFDDAVTLRRRQAGSFSIEYDLPHNLQLVNAADSPARRLPRYQDRRRMPPYPFPFDVVAPCGFVQRLPQVLVLDRLAGWRSSSRDCFQP